jgi:hypothetical protein
MFSHKNGYIAVNYFLISRDIYQVAAGSWQ